MNIDLSYEKSGQSCNFQLVSSQQNIQKDTMFTILKASPSIFSSLALVTLLLYYNRRPVMLMLLMLMLFLYAMKFIENSSQTV